MTIAVLLASTPASMAATGPGEAAPAPPSNPSTSNQGAAAPEAGTRAPANDDPKPIVVTAQPEARQDPLAAVNIQSYKAVQAVDKAVILPVALGYKHALPHGVRTGLRNALLNLTEPVVFVNYVLQLQPKRAVQVFGRFTINSTIGLGGLLDVAKNKAFHLPHHTNGFAYTFGYYGIPNGPYLFLPIIGPTTLRDMVGRTLDQVMIPTVVGFPFTGLTYSLPTGLVNSLDFRVEQDSALKKLHAEENPYGAVRAEYLARRKRDVAALRGPNHYIPNRDEIYQGAKIDPVVYDVPLPGSKAIAPAPAVAPAPAAAPTTGAQPDPGLAPPLAKPAPAPLMLTPAAPPSTKPRP